MGVPTLRELFDERYYADLEGGILESFGRLFKNDLKIYAYPELDAKTGALTTADNLAVARHLRHLAGHLLENRMIEGLDGFEKRCLSIHSRDVLARIRRGERGWEVATPNSVARVIKRRGLLGYPCNEAGTVAAA
jgi:hypothetical protein